MTQLSASPTTKRPTVVSAILAVLAGSVVAILLCFVVAQIAFALGASRDFLALTPGAYGTFIVIGAVIGVIGWALIRRFARTPRRLLDVLVPLVLGLSFIPDILVGVTKALPGTSWTGVIALMVMHVVVAASLVAAYRFFLPVRGASGAPSRHAR